MSVIAVSAAQSAAAAAWATFAVLVITAVFAWRQVREAARLRREQSRPFVVVHYEFRSVLIQLAIRNIGKTVARDVRISGSTRLSGEHRFGCVAVEGDSAR